MSLYIICHWGLVNTIIDFNIILIAMACDFIIEITLNIFCMLINNSIKVDYRLEFSFKVQMKGLNCLVVLIISSICVANGEKVRGSF